MFDPTVWNDDITTCIRKHTRKMSQDQKDDLQQSIYLALIEAQEQIKTAGPEAPKLVEKICVGRINVMRKRDPLKGAIRIGNNIDDIDRRIVPPRPDPFRINKEALKDALASLPDFERAVINGLFYEGRSEEDLATHFGCSQPKISRCKTWALNELHTLLTKED